MPDHVRKPLRSVHRFRNGTLCEMTFHLLPNGMPSRRPQDVWNGQIAKLHGERLDWEPACFCTIADRIKGPTFYGAYLRNGEIKTWRCYPGRKPKRIPFKRTR